MKFFVSYSRSVQNKVREIIASLRDDGEEVWWDQDLRAGQDWWGTILNTVEWCDACLFMISEKSVQSPYCMDELRYALARNRLVLPFVLDGPLSYTIPPEIMKGRIQYEIYSGTPNHLKQRIRITCGTVNWDHYKDLYAARPPEPNTGTSNLVDRLAKSIALAQEGLFDSAIEGFNDVAHNDYAAFGEFCHTWVERINRYKEVVNLSLHESMIKLARPKWEVFLKQYAGEERFDPFGVHERLVPPSASLEQRARDLLSELEKTQNRQTRDALRRDIKALDVVAVVPLIEVLKDSTDEVKRFAAEALGALGDARAVPALIQALGDRSDDVRRYAVDALGVLGSVTAVPALIAALQDTDETVRAWAAEALGNLGDEQAVEPLKMALRDGEKSVRKAASEALIALGVTVLSEEEQHVYDLIDEVRKAHVEGVAFGADPFLYELGGMGEVAVGPVLALLQDPDPLMRTSAVNLLGNLGDPRAIEPIMGLLQDSDWDVRWAACHMLGRFEDVRAIEPLIARLKDTQADVREMAAIALSVFEDTRAVERLIALLTDQNEKVRAAAAQTLGELGDKTAVEGLTRALGDKSEKVRKAAGEALGTLGAPILSAEELRVRDLLEQIRKTDDLAKTKAFIRDIQTVGAPALMLLITALQDRDGSVRGAAAEILGKLRDKQAVGPLIAMLQDPEWTVRWSAVEALGILGDARAVESVIEGLHDENNLVRRSAAEALRSLGDVRAIAPLLKALQDADRDVRYFAVLSLGALGGQQVVKALTQVMKEDKEEWVREAAEVALEKIRSGNREDES